MKGTIAVITLLLLVSALTASTYTISKILLDYSTPLFIVAIRMLGAGIAFLSYYRWKHGPIKVRSARDWSLFLQVAIISFYLSFVGEIWALQYLTSSKVALLYNLSPFIAAVFSYFFFAEQMTLKKFIGLAIGFIGFLPILIDQPISGGVGFLDWPEIVMLGAVTCYTYGWIAMRTLAKKKIYDLTLINGLSMTIGGLMSLVTAYWFEVIPASNPAWITSWLPVTNIWVFIALMAVMIVGGNLISFSLYGYFLRRFTATFVSCIDLTAPIFAALFGVVLLHEHLGWQFFVASFVIFIGIYIYYQEESRQGYFEHE